MKFLQHRANHSPLRAGHSIAMQLKQLLLLCSAMITIAFSFPTGTEHITTTSLPQNETTTQNTKSNNKPFVFIMEEKDPKSDSIIVQFVYSSNGGNSIIQSKHLNKEKYIVDQPKHKGKHEKKSNINLEEEKKIIQEMDKKQLAQKTKINEPKQNSTKDVQTKPVLSLTQEETSPLTGKLPKYLQDALNPIPPFPELQFGKQNKINTNKVQKENVDSYLAYPIRERKESLNVAGPQLNPLSIYDREFNVPIFV